MLGHVDDDFSGRDSGTYTNNVEVLKFPLALSMTRCRGSLCPFARWPLVGSMICEISVEVNPNIYHESVNLAVDFVHRYPD
jgi:hypothetical protein